MHRDSKRQNAARRNPVPRCACDQGNCLRRFESPDQQSAAMSSRAATLAARRAPARILRRGYCIRICPMESRYKRDMELRRAVKRHNRHKMASSRRGRGQHRPDERSGASHRRHAWPYYCRGHQVPRRGLPYGRPARVQMAPSRLAFARLVCVHPMEVAHRDLAKRPGK